MRALADHRIEPVMIPFKGKALPGWFHLPPNYQGGRIPVVISFPGMDTYKEVFVALKGDRWLERGIAVLALDGPGQAECRVLGLTVSMENWTAVGKAAVDWLVARPEIDPQKIGAFGNSFGSFFVTIVTANEPRICACVANSNNLEPGFHAIFEEASPTYKKRFMYMAGFTDEAKFDAFRKTLTWEGHAEKIRVPYLCVAGEWDELSPMVHTERMLKTMSNPRRLVVYQDARHAIGACPSVNLGPHPPTHGGRLDGGALCRQADGERALVCRQQRRGDEDGAVRVYLDFRGEGAIKAQSEFATIISNSLAVPRSRQRVRTHRGRA